MYNITVSKIFPGNSSNIGDEFDFFNSSKWNVVVTGSPYNNDLQYYRDNNENYRVENGALVITPLKQRFVYSLKKLKVNLDLVDIFTVLFIFDILY